MNSPFAVVVTAVAGGVISDRTGHRKRELESARRGECANGERRGRARDATDVVGEALRRRTNRGGIDLCRDRPEPAEEPGAKEWVPRRVEANVHAARDVAGGDADGCRQVAGGDLVFKGPAGHR